MDNSQPCSTIIGHLLDQRYQVTAMLGHGGFGHTFLAEDTRRPGKPTCVVKQLKPPTDDADFLQTARRLFNSEAETLEMLGNHDQIPRLLAYFEEAGDFYLVEEFIDGHPLSQEMTPGSPWSERQVIDLLREVLPILEFVHSHQVIHRDIKPENLIRRNTDQKLVLVDFGAVKQVKLQTLQASDSGNHQTVAIGTPGYMPSEQSQGRPRPSSDIYALGMICIQALTGLVPQQLEEEVQTGEIRWQPMQPGTVSDRLVALISQMVRHYFSYRYQSATEVLAALQPLTQPSAEAMAAVSHLRRYYWEQVCQTGTKWWRSLSGGGSQSKKTTDSAILSSQPSSSPNSAPNSTPNSTPTSTPSGGTSPLLPAHAETLVVAPALPSEPEQPRSEPGKRAPLVLSMPRSVKFVGAVALGAIATLVITRQVSQTQALNSSLAVSGQAPVRSTDGASPTPATSPSSSSAAAQPNASPALKSTCGLIVEPSNVRLNPNGDKSGTILQPDTKVTLTGKTEAGWTEISAPIAGWIWESRVSKTCT
ncbi:MAG: serine/threonine-protein kinase [Synechococcales bacterium]|nr:serine/threonine-protein kinase [Synechococcales bacterium]